MTDLFTFARLTHEQIDQAWPIVQSSLTGTEIGRWREFAHSLIGAPEREAGIIAVQNGGYLHGLFSYAIAPHLTQGCVLSIDNVFVLDLFTPAIVADVLLDAVDGLARRYDCQAVHTTLPQPPGGLQGRGHWLADRFRARGHSVTAKSVCECLTTAEPGGADVTHLSRERFRA